MTSINTIPQRPDFGGRRMFRLQRAFLSGLLPLVLAVSAHAQIPAPPDPLDMTGSNIQQRFKEIEIVQNLDAQVPMDLKFIDENGHPITIAELLGGKPAVLSLVFYECKMLCTEVLNGMNIAFQAMDIKLGDDYNVITVSIDPGETPELARAKKAQYLEAYGRPGGEKGWRFLTGSEDSIETLANTVGFRYAYDPVTDQYAHAAGIMILTPEGKVSRYHYGIDYIPRDLKFGLMEASHGKIGSPVDKLRLLCFLYDPSTGTYGFYVIGAMRILAAAILAALLAFWGIHYLRTRAAASKKRKDLQDPHPDPMGTSGT